MALTMSLPIKGTTYPTAHIEITNAVLDRPTKTVRLEYLVFASRNPATLDFVGNALVQGVMVIPFSSLASPLSTFYTALHDHLLAQFPTASQAADALT